MGLEDRNQVEVCAVAITLGLVGRPELALTTFQMLSDLITAEGTVTVRSQPHCPLPPQKWAFAFGPRPSELLVDPLLVLVRLKLQLFNGDLAILVAILVLEHVPYGFLRVLPRHEASFALTNLRLDEGGELRVRRAQGRAGMRGLLEQLWWPWQGPPGEAQ